MKRAREASESTGPAVVKPQPSPSKVPQPTSEQKEKPTQVQDIQKEVTQATIHKKELLEPEASGSVQKAQVVSGTIQTKSGDVTGQKEPAGKQPKVQVSTAKSEVKPGLAKKEPGKLPQQPPQSVTQPTKSAPPAAQPTKQESGGFFGFGAPKTQPTTTKPAESVTGKMFGFGSSIFSSASTLITSAVQEEPKITPPTHRKMSTAAPVSPKAAPPVSPKIIPAKDIKPLAPAQQTKPAPAPAQEKVEKASPESVKSTEEVKAASKAILSTCPLCKVELNMGSEDPPNYNTCTECKNTVCNLCGFNPMPHTKAVSTINVTLLFKFWPKKMGNFSASKERSFH